MSDTLKKTLDDFKETIRQDAELAEQIRKSTLQEIVTLAKAKGFDISTQQLEEAVRLNGGTGSSDAIIVWENYVVAG